jgi:hypothetical protein
MSRLLVSALLATLLLPSPVMAQRASDAEIASQIEKARRLVAVDDEGCIKYPKNDEIVVCGENPDNKQQKLDPGPVDNDRIRRGEAVSTERAAGCTYGDKLCRTPLDGTPFGTVPPVALDYFELMKGLPEPDMIVTDGEPAAPPP